MDSIRISKNIIQLIVGLNILTNKIIINDTLLDNSILDRICNTLYIPPTIPPPALIPCKIECYPVKCKMYCPYGWDIDKDGCEICKCKENNNDNDIIFEINAPEVPPFPPPLLPPFPPPLLPPFPPPLLPPFPPKNN